MSATPPRPARPARPSPRGTMRTVLLFVGALLFLFEEWLWAVATRFFAWLGRFGAMRWLDAQMARLPPVAALVLLCVPMVLLFPLKIVGLWMIGSGRFVSGCMLMLAAKIVGTAVFARIFIACRPQLLQMPWFARLHAWTGVLRTRIHRWLAEQPAWNEAKRFVRHARAHVRAWMHGTTVGAAGPDGTFRRGALHRWRSRRRTRRESTMAASLARTREQPPRR